MGNTIFLKDRRVCVKPLRSRLEAMYKNNSNLQQLKGCRSFVEMVNFLSMFCPELQKIIKTYICFNKERQTIHMGKRAANSILRNKAQIKKTARVLYLFNSTRRFHLYSDTSKFAMSSTLYQIQNRKPKLIAYASKRLPETAGNYSITELESCVV